MLFDLHGYDEDRYTDVFDFLKCADSLENRRCKVRGAVRTSYKHQKKILTAKKYRKTHGKKIFICLENNYFDDIKYGL